MIARRAWRLAAVLLAFPLAAPGWYPLGGDLWRDGPVLISFGTTPATPRGVVDWEGAVREAANAWNASLQRIQLEVVPPVERVWYENGHNEVFFDRNFFDDPFPSGVLGVSFSTHDRERLIENDVVINSSYDWSVYRGPWQRTTMDFRRVVVHELGHLLGLAHPDENGQTVSAIMHSRAGDIETPTADDQEGTRALYDFGPGIAPLIVEQPRDASVVQGNPARLSVFAAGRDLLYEWQRNGVPVAGATASGLQLHSTPNESGEYTVTVANGAGAVTSRIANVVVSPAQRPQVGALGSDTLDPAPAGADVTLTARVDQGSSPLTYEWRKDGVRLPVSSSPRVTLEDVQFSDGGSYTVTVSNAAGAATSPELRFSVAPPVAPHLLHEAPSVTLGIGGGIALDAPVRHAPGQTYQWLKDGVPIAGQTETRFTVASFTPDQAGRYSVVVTNAFGSMTIAGGEITGMPPSDFMIARQPGAAIADPGEDVFFAVEMARPVTSYQWLKDGVPLTESPLRSGVRSATMWLGQVSFDSAGVYSVEVSDGARRLRSHGARLTVQAPAAGTRITTQPAHHSVTVGQQVTLSLQVSPPNEPWSYQWLKDAAPIPGATTATLSFANAKATDAGRYRARATWGGTTLETDDAEIEIVDTPRPYFPSHPPSRVFVIGSEELRLTGVADEVVRRRVEREGGVYYYTRDGERITSPYVNPVPVATYTMTRGMPGMTETSRPFALTFAPPPNAVRIRQHPRGGAFVLGSEVILEARTAGNVPMQWRKNGGATLHSGSALVLSPFQASDVGVYTVQLMDGASSVSEPALVEILGFPSPLITLHPSGRTARMGDSVQLEITPTRPDLSIQWFKDGAAISGATRDSLPFTASAQNTGNYHVVVSDGMTAQTSRTAAVQLMASARAPQILSQPSGVRVAAGGGADLAALVDGSPPPDRYQWRKDGVPIPGATDAKLKLRNVSGEAAGVYTVVATNSASSVVSQPATVVVDERARLVNLAARATVGLGAELLFAGFTINGTEPRQLLVRGIGDQLSEFGVSGVLRDPVVKIFDAKAQLLASNDDWFRSDEEALEVLEDAARQAGAFAPRRGARDAAILITLQPGSYTAQVSGLVDTTGIGLVEIYDLSQPASGRIVNLSSRAVVGTDANILIPGLTLRGPKPRRLLIRAVGPGLAGFGVADPLADPMLAVFHGTERVAGNDNWDEGASPAAVAEAGAALGAFPLAAGSRDAAVLLELPPGSYTVQVSGAQRSTGPALVEVYELP